jgi:hypothetical protein
MTKSHEVCSRVTHSMDIILCEQKARCIVRRECDAGHTFSAGRFINIFAVGVICHLPLLSACLSFEKSLINTMAGYF